MRTNPATITVTLKNIAQLTISNVDFHVIIPGAFLIIQGTNEYSGYLRPGEEIEFSFKVRAYWLGMYEFQADGTYQDNEGIVHDIPEEVLFISVENYLVLGYPPAGIEVLLSPEMVIQARSWVGAENIVAASWLYSVLNEFNVDDLTAGEFFQKAMNLADLIKFLMERGSDVTMIIGILGDIGFNTLFSTMKYYL